MEYAIVFFEELYKCEYPFSKLDLVFAPDYLQECQSSAGRITLTEDFLRKDSLQSEQVHSEQKQQMIIIAVFREIAQAWLGNSVSIRWWNDLWLQRALASYAALLCFDEAAQRGSAMHFLDGYFAALEQDQKDSTQPICQDVERSDIAHE